MGSLESRQYYVASVTLLAADAVKVLIPAKSGFHWVITSLYRQVTTAAAQIVEISEQGQAQPIYRIPLSATGEGGFGPLFQGIKAVTPNSFLRATPASAGPEVNFIIEAYYVPASV